MSTTEDRTPDPQAPADSAARVYHVLGELYVRPPTADLVAEVSTWATRWRSMDPDPAIAAALEPLAAANAADAEALNEECTRLFRGVTPFSPDPPYESLYRDGSLQGPSAESVLATYREAGVTVAPETGELADHLGLELHFLGMLYERGDAAEAEAFLEAHPRRWFEDFAETIRAEDPVPFYTGLLDLTALALQTEGPDR